jgi:nucleotide-binding universal stress UspA family protein
MKTILISTDFSSAAKNAADYAAQLSRTTGSPLVLFHAWSIPALSAESLTIPVTVEDLEQITTEALLEEAGRLEKTWGVKAEQVQKAGFASDEIEICAAEKEAGIVVMGMAHREKIEQVFGSVATSVLHRSKFPALIIPEHVSFSPPKTFLFATDLQSQSDWHELDMLAEVAAHLQVGIHILNAVQEKHPVEANQSSLGIQLEQRLKEFPHSWHFPTDGDVVHAITQTAKEIEADWIAIVPHKRSWFKQLFHHSVSSELAFNANCPILALPEGKAK